MIKKAKLQLSTLKFDFLTVMSLVALLISIFGFMIVTFFLVPFVYINPHIHTFEMLILFNAPLLILIILFLGILTKRRWSSYLCYLITINLILYMALDFIFTLRQKGYLNYNDKSTVLVVGLFIALSWYLRKIKVRLTQ